jgi:hypothetical protein
MSQLDTTMTSESILPGITPTTAIPAIYANDSTFNTVGGDQIFITNNYNVDPNCDRGIWTNHLRPSDSDSSFV